MRCGAAVALGIIITVGPVGPACADAIVHIVNASRSPVTVRIDGAFGCRAESAATSAPDMDMANRCSFGATTGSHLLAIHFDNGRESSRSISIPNAGCILTLTGAE